MNNSSSIQGRLQQSIQDMQQTLDNVQKELSGRRWPPAKERYVPEHDDNAVMMTPSHTVAFTAALRVVHGSLSTDY